MTMQGAEVIVDMANFFSMDQAEMWGPARSYENGVWLVAATKAQSTAPTHIALGVWFAQRKQFSCAIPSFETALRFDTNLWEAHYDLALALIATGRAQKAEEHLRAALPSAPDTAQVPLHLGQVLSTQRRYSAAVPYLKEAVRMAPSLPARLALGAALSGAGPSVLVFLDPKGSASKTRSQVAFSLRQRGLEAELILTSIASRGARDHAAWKKAQGRSQR